MGLPQLAEAVFPTTYKKKFIRRRISLSRLAEDYAARCIPADSISTGIHFQMRAGFPGLVQGSAKDIRMLELPYRESGFC